MPRNGSNIYSIPPGTEGFPDTTIESKKYNDYIHDVETDLNTPRPISVGGTGANNAEAALINLQGEKAHQIVTNYNSHAFVSGSFESLGATGDPTEVGSLFLGHAVVNTTGGWAVLTAHDMGSSVQPGRTYIREYRNDAWTQWKLDSTGVFGPSPPTNPPDGTLWWDSASGHLFVWYVDPDGTEQWVTASPFPDPARFLLKSGDTMEGTLGLAHAPTQPMHAANKSYVDSSISAIPPIDISGKVNKSGDTMSGPLAVNNEVYAVNFHATSNLEIGTATATGTIFFGSYTNGNLLRYDGTNFVLNGGNININGDVIAGVLRSSRIGLPAEGIVNFGNSGSNYLHFNGSSYNFVGAPVNTQNLSSANITAGGNITHGGGVQSSASDAAIGGSGGYIYFRPHGIASGLNQVTVTNAGDVILNNGSFFPPNAANGGYQCKAADTNTVMGDYFNTHWVGIPAFYINNTYMGNLTIGSDYRIKKDVSLLPSTWGAVKKLKPIKYTQREFTPPSEIENAKKTGAPFFKADNIERWGFVAHELQETLVDSAANGAKDQANCIQSVNPMTVIAALTKALQEAIERIEALEARK